MKTLLVGLVATALSGCVAGAGYGYTTGLLHGASHASPPSSRGAMTGAASGPAYAPGEDQHWFSSDDYLVAPADQHREKVQHMRVAKMIEPPAAGSRGEAHFLVANGTDLWTDNFFQSRVVGPADLAVNALAFCHVTSTYRTETAGPQNKQDARNDSWYFGAITDTSDTYKGRISLGSRSCPIDAARVPIR
jgi:hypothetical protein